ncbi:MAG: hypothetical protein WAM53_19180, partial [Terrimicrobiaceae bacterium]
PPQRVLRRAVVPPRTIFNAAKISHRHPFRKHFLNNFGFKHITGWRETSYDGKNLNQASTLT